MKNLIKIEIKILGKIRTNCYILSDEAKKQAIVIDPADEADQIIAYLDQNDLELKAVLMTHGHFDHMTGLKDLMRARPGKVYAAREEQELLSNPQWNCSESFGRPIEAEADVLVEDGQILEFGEMRTRVISTPGHTKGSVCFYFEEEGALFSGDTLFFESVGRTDLPTGNGQLILESLTSKLMILPDEVTVYPGHGSKTSIGYERRNNPYLNGNGWE